MEGAGCRSRVVVGEGAVERLSRAHFRGLVYEELFFLVQSRKRKVSLCCWYACVVYIYRYNVRVVEVEGSQCLCDQWIDGCSKK